MVNLDKLKQAEQEELTAEMKQTIREEKIANDLLNVAILLFIPWVLIVIFILVWL